ncbi:tyrosine-type recombinase/integrase [Methylocystis sp. IM2]|uniref:tyrosine-type recombinase/integrase n=1 Tax=Methylocystis sp. IM2 TaxID=3136563 RepID=UPI0030F88590
MDGDCLYLVVFRDGSKGFLFKPRFRGKKIEIRFEADSLKEARDKRAAYALQMRAGQDPRQIKRQEKASASNADTFGAVADQVYQAKRSGWRSEKHADQWRHSIFKDCPRLLGMRVAEITSKDVLETVLPIYKRSYTAGKRTQERIAVILDTAREMGLMPYDRRNAADIKNLVPAKPDVERKHHEGWHYSQIPQLFEALRKVETIAARCLEFLYLTGCRSNEARAARWEEFEGLGGESPTWILPASRMKRGRAHRIPLSPQAARILLDLKARSASQFVFEGRGRKDPHISNQALHDCLDKNVDKTLTVHGSRSAFRGWLDEVRRVPITRARQALAHKTGTDIDEAYLRTDGLDERRKDIEAWGRYCYGIDATVTPLRLPA